MKKVFLLIFSILFISLPVQAVPEVHSDGSWNSPLVYAFDNTSPIDLPTQFKVESDKENLYITVKCSEPAMAQLKKIPVQKERNWPMCDSVEIFIDPPQLKKYVQLAVGVNGMFYDSRKNKNKVDWTYELNFYDDFWQLKFTIPFEDLGVTAEVGDCWKFNLCRNVRLSGNYNSTWAFVGSDFHNPVNFGTLTFGSKSAAANARQAKMKKELDKLKRELQQKNIYPELRQEIEAAEKNCTMQKINAIREEALMVEALKGL